MTDRWAVKLFSGIRGGYDGISFSLQQSMTPAHAAMFSSAQTKKKKKKTLLHESYFPAVLEHTWNSLMGEMKSLIICQFLDLSTALLSGQQKRNRLLHILVYEDGGNEKHCLFDVECIILATCLCMAKFLNLHQLSVTATVTSPGPANTIKKQLSRLFPRDQSQSVTVFFSIHDSLVTSLLGVSPFCSHMVNQRCVHSRCYRMLSDVAALPHSHHTTTNKCCLYIVTKHWAKAESKYPFNPFKMALN